MISRVSRPHVKFLFCITMLGVTINGQAVDAEKRGLEIVQEADRRDQGFSDLTANITMIIKEQNKERVRHLSFSSLEMKNDGEKRLFVFHRPADIKGTAVLNHTHIQEDDDQWIFLPAFKRVKRISSANKTRPFVGSEFSYEDLVSIEIPKYQYRYLGEGTVNQQFCYKVQFIPGYNDSGYSRQVVYFDKQHYRILKVEFFDDNNKPVKTLSTKGYRQYNDKYWRPDVMHMVNHQNGRETIMKWENISLQNGLRQRDFTVTALKRAR